jgi:branched-chain amino acid aminotransferase
MIRTWKITPNKTEEVYFPDQSSLDVITRQLPDGYYSTFRTFNGCTRILGLKAHLHRLPNVDASSLRRNLIQLLEPYRPDEARVRVMMTFQGDVYIAIEPLKLLPREVYEKGVRVETTATQRKDPRIKSTSFIARSEEDRKHIATIGIFEALLVKNGKILEGMTSNFFYVAQVGNLRYIGTAQRDILLGVTRRTVIRVARGRGLEVRYSPLKLDQLSAVKEAFITSSSRGIVPVVQIDDVLIGQGRPGEITQMLISAYEENVLKAAEKI